MGKNTPEKNCTSQTIAIYWKKKCKSLHRMLNDVTHRGKLRYIYGIFHMYIAVCLPVECILPVHKTKKES